MSANKDNAKPNDDLPAHDAGGGGSRAGQSIAQQLVLSASASGSLHVDHHGQTWWSEHGSFGALQVGGRAFKRKLYISGHKRKIAVNKAAVDNTVATLDAIAHEHANGDTWPIYNRCGGDYERVYLALHDPDGTVIEVGADGWRRLEQQDPVQPVLFARPADAKALPMPTKPEHSLRQLLAPFVNVEPEDWPLLLGWLVGAFMPAGPYAILALCGEQGSAKSYTARTLRAVGDPSAVPDRGVPKDMDAVAAAAKACRIVVFDNLSFASEDLSDLLCRLATGAGIGKRAHYENNEEVTLRLQRPLILNGIPELATRSDLASRTISLALPQVAARRTEADLDRDWRAAHPAILGALLDAVSCALRDHASTKLDGEAPRLADLAVWVEAAAPALGLAKGEFEMAFKANQEQGQQTVMDGSALSTTLQSIALDGFDGTPAELLTALNTKIGDQRGDRGWPRTPATLATAVRRLAGPLRTVGYEVEFPKRRGKRIIVLGRPSTAAPVGADPPPRTTPPADQPGF